MASELTIRMAVPSTCADMESSLGGSIYFAHVSTCLSILDLRGLCHAGLAKKSPDAARWILARILAGWDEVQPKVAA